MPVRVIECCQKSSLTLEPAYVFGTSRDLWREHLNGYFPLEMGVCGPVIYNEAIRDAQRYFQDRVVDLEGTCFEPEFGYWDD